LALQNSGLRVVLTEETSWIGGQLTSQAVPPDEHPWIESFGCTAGYRRFRNLVREEYRRRYRLSNAAAQNPSFNPGGGWVSRLCHEPKIALAVLESMLHRGQTSGHLTVLTRHVPIAAEIDCDHVRSVQLKCLESGETVVINARFVLDATESGDLLPLAEIEFVQGAEARSETGEAHAPETAEPKDVQGITWCFAMSYDALGEHVIEKPSTYGQWRAYSPEFWVGPLLSWNTLHAHTMQPYTWTLFGKESPTGMGLFDYRQIVSPLIIDEPGIEPATIVNWPQNDYFAGPVLGVEPTVREKSLKEAKELSLSLLYWLQTEAPRPDGGAGWPGLRLRPDLVGTADGFAMAPYIRESRRIKAVFTVLEQYVSAHDNPGRPLARAFEDSVGIGAYRIDLHPSVSGRNTIDFSSLPFQIPLGALVPVRMKNLLPACKNLGVTHITNGCYRLHPVEWNIGEAAGTLAAFCLEGRHDPQKVAESSALTADLQARLQTMGVELGWPNLGPL
jgi:hypothetical protein